MIKALLVSACRTDAPPRTSSRAIQTARRLIFGVLGGPRAASTGRYADFGHDRDAFTGNHDSSQAIEL